MRAVRLALHRTAVAGAVMAWTFASIASAAADPGAASLERRVKAAFVATFPGYVEWPAGAMTGGRALTIGVARDDAIAAELEQAVAGPAAHDPPMTASASTSRAPPRKQTGSGSRPRSSGSRAG